MWGDVASSSGTMCRIHPLRKINVCTDPRYDISSFMVRNLTADPRRISLQLSTSERSELASTLKNIFLIRSRKWLMERQLFGLKGMEQTEISDSGMVVALNCGPDKRKVLTNDQVFFWGGNSPSGKRRLFLGHTGLTKRGFEI
jgi:hypothetical protein